MPRILGKDGSVDLTSFCWHRLSKEFAAGRYPAMNVNAKGDLADGVVIDKEITHDD